MTYPRRCPLCELLYTQSTQSNVAGLTEHQTVSAVEGGTPSPWRPELPGHVLTLRCMACAGLFTWDYFGSQQVGETPD